MNAYAEKPLRSPAGVHGTAVVLTVLIIVLGAVASAGGLFIPGLYRDNSYMVAQAVGQDVVTLFVAVPALCMALFYVIRGSAPATLAWLGLLGYMLYTYTTMAFGAAFNPFFLIYVALFSLSIFTLIAAISGMDAPAWPKRFDAATPRRTVAGFLLFCGVMVAALWLPEIIRYLVTGKLPETLVLAGIPTNFVYVMDLGLVVPLALLSGISLWRRLPRGYILAGVVLTKAATMGLALISMVLFMYLDGHGLDVAPAVMSVIVASGGIVLMTWFFRHCHS